MFIYVKNQISNKIRQFLLTFLFFNQKKCLNLCVA